eukprot:CAMPEP_0202862410 /NCGR_PEP_ID=MMETSP1391-20130828/3466_1 /ASSEMBLY_ACC=CAM_ASM_000867 /TAXON_ID=1034604 /ORGANISM="Chlamydomonas leiostraca, Strain SAG 11-49" /LENGTH=102 /DNA_ID=CAMNT_0049541947 /DNA_START=83 /DNA_END=387 /DNA_ORIENTATION=-
MSLRRAWQGLVEGRWAQNLLSRMAMPRDRRQQEAMDMERLCMLSACWHAPHLAQQHMLQAKALSPSEQRRVVQAHVEERVLAIARAVHEPLDRAGDAGPAQA